MMGVFEAAAQESSHRQRQPARTRGDGRTFAEIAADRQAGLDKRIAKEERHDTGY